MLKVQRARAKSELKTKVNDTWLFIAEFGTYYGWDGVKAIRNNEISMEEVEVLMMGARKVWNGKLYDHMTAAFVGAGSAQSKKPSKTFNTATKDLLRQTKADV